MRLNFLITGSGAPGIKGTLYSLKNSHFWNSCKCIGVDINPEAVGKYLLDSFYQVPAVENENYFSTIVEIAKKEKIDLVIPQTTKEIEYFSKNKQLYEERGIN